MTEGLLGSRCIVGLIGQTNTCVSEPLPKNVLSLFELGRVPDILGTAMSRTVGETGVNSDREDQ